MKKRSTSYPAECLFLFTTGREGEVSGSPVLPCEYMIHMFILPRIWAVVLRSVQVTMSNGYPVLIAISTASDKRPMAVKLLQWILARLLTVYRDIRPLKKKVDMDARRIGVGAVHTALIIHRDFRVVFLTRYRTYPYVRRWMPSRRGVCTMRS
jgi:hypothetical protein